MGTARTWPSGSRPASQRGLAPDGSYLSRLRSADGKRHLRVRVVEFDVRLPDGSLSELFCVATTLLDHDQVPASEIADLYKERRPAAETTIGQAKSTITDAGPSRGPMLRSKDPDLVEQEVWAWLAGNQLLRKAAYAITRTTTGVDPDEVSYTTVRREAARSLTQSLVTATTTPQAAAAAAAHAARRALANRVTTNRQRHSPRVQKCRSRFRHTSTTKTTTKGALEVYLSKPPTLSDPVPADTS